MNWLFVVISIIIILAFYLRSSYERVHLVTEHFTVWTDKLIDTRELTIVFLSDLHNNEFGCQNEKLREAIDDVHPDFILSGGDLMICKGKKNIDIPVSLLKKLAEKYPVYCGNGNHEVRMRHKTDVYGDQYQIYVDTLRESGIIYLEDEMVKIPVGSHDYIVLSSLDLEKRYYKKWIYTKMDQAYLEYKLGKPDKRYIQITLIHSPQFLKAAANWGSDLVLSGHFHGGTIRLPFLGAVMSPQFQFFPKYAEGEFQKKQTKMVVSRGLGTHSINIRFNNKPQLVVVHLQGKSI